jgi:hypothetical protein
VIEAQRETIQVRAAPGEDAPDQLLRGDPIGLGLEHDGGAMGVIGAYQVNPGAHHALEPRPDVDLDVFHDVADVQGTIGVGQGAGDEEFS